MAKLASWRTAVVVLASTSLINGQTTAESTSKADGLVSSQSSTNTGGTATATISGSQTTYSVAFTVPASADNGPNLLPNIKNTTAVQAQDVCPGYKASGVQRTAYGFSASLTLAGNPCNVYGTDIEELTLTVDVQTAHRLNVNIKPAHLDSSNITQYVLSEDLIPFPAQGFADPTTQNIDLQFSWSNDPSFSFTVVRKSTGDVLFDTRGSVLVYENQFIEFVTQLPEDYNLYGMGERIHDLRLGNNFTATFYAADAGDPIDGNIYGSHPFYLDTRYYEVDAETGAHTLVTTQNTSASNQYVGMSHGVFQRSAHGMEALLLPTNLTWRALGGSIDLYFFDGPTQDAVTKQYQIGAIGLPAQQQYWTLGFHQCRWG
ncbi:hypothetical protein B0A48_03490 [Cryoendolithus antarcticus]|uniref:Glycoside hydrolase family 31 N-terminal domain-containing protein n=1 Tax=Cryoendolithus antarcticus TaxID=1507870 RepID=A0A1V8TK56_9PEZI|nr:hypothetical protein B0A48_03490 [Cryoendolithus antarcticus]